LQAYKKGHTAGLNVSQQVGQKRSKNDLDKPTNKAEKTGRKSVDNSMKLEEESRPQQPNDIDNGMLLMDINDSFIFKESPAR